MPVSEFDLIRLYFERQTRTTGEVTLGIGDDCALLRPRPGQELAVTIDTLIEGRHFPAETGASAVGHKALAVSLSDLAAMGAEPAWFTLALSLPRADETWLKAFAEGLFGLARATGVELVGGDTTRGPLSITVQAAGWLPVGQGLRRDGARIGDDIYVTGTLGGAGLALQALYQRCDSSICDRVIEQCRDRLDRPTPRLGEGMALRGIAHSAIDISDGLLADLGHILDRSGVGACLELAAVPAEIIPGLDHEMALQSALRAGDDYELCFTAASDRADQVMSCCPQAVRIGVIEAGNGIRARLESGECIVLDPAGFDHFGGNRP